MRIVVVAVRDSAIFGRYPSLMHCSGHATVTSELRLFYRRFLLGCQRSHGVANFEPNINISKHRERSIILVQLIDSDHGRPFSQESMEYFRHWRKAKLEAGSVGFSVGDVDDRLSSQLLEVTQS